MNNIYSMNNIYRIYCIKITFHFNHLELLATTQTNKTLKLLP